MVHYEVYANVDHENNELNRNVYNMVRDSLYYENFYKTGPKGKDVYTVTFFFRVFHEILTSC